MKQTLSTILFVIITATIINSGSVYADDPGRIFGLTAGGAAIGGLAGGGRGAGIGAATGLLVGLATQKNDNNSNGSNRRSRGPSRRERELERELNTVNRQIDRINKQIIDIENGTRTADKDEIKRLNRLYKKLKERREYLEDELYMRE
jgi:hypothetical protein